MRDLYARLRLGFGADDAALRRAITASVDAELARRAREVLLTPERRAAHDAVYVLARQLRDWRIELRLEDGAWASELADSDLVRPNLPAEPLAAPIVPAAAGWRRWLANLAALVPGLAALQSAHALQRESQSGSASTASGGENK